jgi:hypothetical protein
MTLMGARDKDREKEYSPNPDFNRPINEHPEATRARLHDYHRRAGTLGTYYEMYPDDRPRNYGLTAEERAIVEGRQGGQERER